MLVTNWVLLRSAAVVVCISYCVDLVQLLLSHSNKNINTNTNTNTSLICVCCLAFLHSLLWVVIEIILAIL